MTDTSHRLIEQAPLATKAMHMPVQSARMAGGIVEPAKRREARRAIKRLYAWDALRKSKPADKAHWFPLLRTSQLESLYETRYRGFTLPDDDDGRDSLKIIADHIAHLGGEVESHIIAWASCWCPWMSHNEAEVLAKRVAANPQKYKAATLGWRLRLTDIERAELGITTFRSIDCITDEQMRERRRQRDRAYQARRRRLERPHKPEPVSRIRPWESKGISLATWYRRRRETERVDSRVDSLPPTKSVSRTAPAAVQQGATDKKKPAASPPTPNLCHNASLQAASVSEQSERCINTARNTPYFWGGLQ